MNNMITIAELPQFIRKAEKLMSEKERTKLVSYLAHHYEDGVIIQGTGGLRKIRVASERKGKSGSFRVIYYYYNEEKPIYLITVFGKNEKDNISSAEKKIFANFIKQLKEELRS